MALDLVNKFRSAGRLADLVRLVSTGTALEINYADSLADAVAELVTELDVDESDDEDEDNIDQIIAKANLADTETR